MRDHEHVMVRQRRIRERLIRVAFDSYVVVGQRRRGEPVGRVAGMRRLHRPRQRGALRGFTAVVDHAALGDQTEALIELFFSPGTLLDTVAETLRQHPEVVEAWSVTGEADAIARVRTRDNADLERVIIDLQRNGLVERTRSQIVMSQLLGPPEA